MSGTHFEHLSREQITEDLIQVMLPINLLLVGLNWIEYKPHLSSFSDKVLVADCCVVYIIYISFSIGLNAQ